MRRQRLRAGAAYFAVAFAAGFVMGTVRELLIVPRLGLDAGLMIEAPVMALVSLFAARWSVRRFAVPPAASDRLGMALVGLGLLVLAEEALTRMMRGTSVFEHWAGLTSTGNAINGLGLVIFLLMPLVVGRPRGAAR